MFPLTELTEPATPVVPASEDRLGKIDGTRLYVTAGAGFFGRRYRWVPSRRSP